MPDALTTPSPAGGEQGQATAQPPATNPNPVFPWRVTSTEHYIIQRAISYRLNYLRWVLNLRHTTAEERAQAMAEVHVLEGVHIDVGI